LPGFYSLKIATQKRGFFFIFVNSG